ncbi:MAG: UDP-N-acetylmuramate dehydrogenase [Balneola sp.]|nr:MAG: UDP-N-acetylmuramate dehydrogenase [Balneola sp.]
MISIKEKVELAPFTTMGVSALARYFVECINEEDLLQACTFAKKNNLDVLVLGEGSNILFVKDYEGLIILNRIKGFTIVQEDNESVTLKIGAGENWHSLVIWSVEKGYSGIENLSLIPGTVGAAPIQNIGAYGVELKEVFVELEALHLETMEHTIWTKEQCKFGYRDSIFKRELKGKVIISSVTLKLSKMAVPRFEYASLKQKLEEKGIHNPGIKDVSDAVIEVRQSKLPDPNEIGNTGSFFKNPVISVFHFDELKKEHPKLPGYAVTEHLVKVPAGWLIEQAGWKGKRKGDAGVHDKQALVLVNHGNATGKEMWNLALQVVQVVKQKFGIELNPEVNII